MPVDAGATYLVRVPPVGASQPAAFIRTTTYPAGASRAIVQTDERPMPATSSSTSLPRARDAPHLAGAPIVPARRSDPSGIEGPMRAFKRCALRRAPCERAPFKRNHGRPDSRTREWSGMGPWPPPGGRRESRASRDESYVRHAHFSPVDGLCVCVTSGCGCFHETAVACRLVPSVGTRLVPGAQE